MTRIILSIAILGGQDLETRLVTGAYPMYMRRFTTHYVSHALVRALSTRRPPAPHNLLGVAKDATHGEINEAFRKRAKMAHPDAGGTNASFNALMNARGVMLAGGSPEADRHPATRQPKKEQQRQAHEQAQAHTATRKQNGKEARQQTKKEQQRQAHEQQAQAHTATRKQNKKEAREQAQAQAQADARDRRRRDEENAERAKAYMARVEEQRQRELQQRRNDPEEQKQAEARARARADQQAAAREREESARMAERAWAAKRERARAAEESARMAERARAAKRERARAAGKEHSPDAQRAHALTSLREELSVKARNLDQLNRKLEGFATEMAATAPTDQARLQLLTTNIRNTEVQRSDLLDKMEVDEHALGTGLNLMQRAKPLLQCAGFIAQMRMGRIPLIPIGAFVDGRTSELKALREEMREVLKRAGR